ncbi:hypothetical protein B0H16DRAFT_1452179 [Mycena metata]|uniref:Uncharacterized protein n=1 Tax=Mycena metata TaxID=1033252 RepID=A0AAD7JUH3_9AGAR|nr:hypothetical protein B0H16DRAFT_1452179 [Mycena metata]
MYNPDDYEPPPSRLYLDDHRAERQPDRRIDDLYYGQARGWPDSGDSRIGEGTPVHPPPVHPGNGRRSQLGYGPPPQAFRSTSLNTPTHLVSHNYPRNPRSTSAQYYDAHAANLFPSGNFMPPGPSRYERSDYEGQMQRPGNDSADLAAAFEALWLEREEKQALAEDNARLKAQIEHQAVALTPAPSSRGTGFGSRGKVTARKQKPRQQSVAEEPRGGSQGEPAAGLSEAVLLTKDALTTPQLKKARAALQSFVTKTFRDVCGVPVKSRWPDPRDNRVNEITGEDYLTPFFDLDVDHRRNEQAYNDLQNEKNWPSAVSAVNVTWDLPLINDLAVASFRNLRPDWKKQVDDDARARDELKKRNNRWTQRRVTKLDQMKKVVDKYAEANGIDPAPIKAMLCEEHIVTSRQAADNANVLEVVAPDWRADELSNLFHDMHRFWYSTLDASEKSKISFLRARNSGRHGHRIPETSPYNFGISFTWLEEARREEENIELLKDWGKWGNPPGLENVMATLTSTHDSFEDRSIQGAGDEDTDLTTMLLLAGPQVAVDPAFDFSR